MARSNSGNGGGTTLATVNAATAAPPAIKAMLEQSFDRLAAVLPQRGPLTPEKQIQVVSTLLFKTPDLQRCDPRSIVASVLEASELGLSLSRSSGEAYLVPFGRECQFLPGYRGLVKLAYQSGAITLIQGRVVRQGDEFRYAFTPDLDFLHVPRLDSDGVAVTHAYAYAKLASGERLIEVLTAAAVEKVRARSRAGKSVPWVSDWDEMAKKTALKRLCKILPRSEQLERAIEAEERQYQEETAPSVRVLPGAPGMSRSAALAARLGTPVPMAAPEEEPVFAPGTPTTLYTEAEELPAEEAPEPGSAG